MSSAATIAAVVTALEAVSTDLLGLGVPSSIAASGANRNESDAPNSPRPSASAARRCASDHDRGRAEPAERSHEAERSS